MILSEGFFIRQSGVQLRSMFVVILWFVWVFFCLVSWGGGIFVFLQETWRRILFFFEAPLLEKSVFYSELA